MDTARPESGELETASAVIAALGGVSAVATLTGRSYRNVWNWKKDGRFAARTYEKIRSALAARGLSARPSLWGIESPSEEAE